MTVFITGDRYMSATYPTLAAVEMIRALSNGEDIAAVDFPGAVPLILQQLAAQAGMELTLFAPHEDEKLDAFHQRVIDAIPELSEIVMIHDAPMKSTVYQSLARIASDDLLRLASYADLMV